MKKSTNLESKTVTFDDGEGTVQTFELDNCTPEMIIQLALHGARQKIGDSYSNSKEKTADLDMTANEYAVSQVTSNIAQVYAGDWSIRSGAGGPQITDLARAISEVTGKTVEECIEMLSEQDKEVKKQLRADPAIKGILARLTAERAIKKAAAAEKAAAETEASDLAGLFA